MNWPWSELGLEGPADLETIKHAYAERLKTTHPEEDPEGFQRLHEAYQQARKLAENREQGGWRPSELQNEAYNRLFQREERKPEIDFDELLREAPPSRTEPEEPETDEESGDFDFDALIGSTPPQRPKPESRAEDFDFERLFAEGDEERKQAQRRQAEERLRAARERRQAQ